MNLSKEENSPMIIFIMLDADVDENHFNQSTYRACWISIVNRIEDDKNPWI